MDDKLSYNYRYTYICYICNTVIELKTVYPINKKDEPNCICNNVLEISSYFGPNGKPMYE